MFLIIAIIFFCCMLIQHNPMVHSLTMMRTTASCSSSFVLRRRFERRKDLVSSLLLLSSSTTTTTTSLSNFHQAKKYIKPSKTSTTTSLYSTTTNNNNNNNNNSINNKIENNNYNNYNDYDDDDDDSDSELFKISLRIETMDDMEEIGALLSLISQPPDVLFLDGDLGAGKTTFSRGFITCKLDGGSSIFGFLSDDDNDDDNDEEGEEENISVRVTSPTYLLSNTYTYHNTQPEKNIDYDVSKGIELPGNSPDEFYPLHLDHVFNECISLVEWPSRLTPFSDLMPPITNLLNVNISIIPSTDERIMRLTASNQSTWKERLTNLVEEEILDDLLLEHEEEEEDRYDE